MMCVQYRGDARYHRGGGGGGGGGNILSTVGDVQYRGDIMINVGVPNTPHTFFMICPRGNEHEKVSTSLMVLMVSPMVLNTPYGT